MRCGRCGNDNGESNRFCGMCGAPLVAKPPGDGPMPDVAAGNIAPQRQAGAPPPIVSRQPTPASRGVPTALDTPAERHSMPATSSRLEPRPAPVITGPSFLGLNTPAPDAVDRHGDSSITRHPLQPSSGNLDYLLDDEEEPKGGRGKLVLVVVALALAVGFGYLHWKRGGFDWLNGGDKKAATKATPDVTQTTPDSSAPGTDHKASTPPPTASAPVTPIPTDAGSANPGDSTAANAAPSQPAPQAAASPTTSPQTTPAAKPNDPDAASDSPPHPAASDSEEQSSEDEPAVTEKPAARRPVAAKPSAAKPTTTKPSATRPYDSVSEAERYIYGRGVAQDCDHGLRLLKPGAEANPKAMISLGTLYSTGTCTPRDLPTAYRWFAMALHKQPDNQALQDDLQKLWSRMTQPERQLAIKLSQ